MTIRHRGGGHKSGYRTLDLNRDTQGSQASVQSLHHHPNRPALIALVEYPDGDKPYIIAQHGLQVGQQISAGAGSAPEIGNALPLAEIPLGTIISCVELRPGQGAIMARSAGTFAQLIARDGKFVTIKLPSGEIRLVLTTCLATIGAVSNSDHQLLVSGKAG